MKETKAMPNIFSEISVLGESGPTADIPDADRKQNGFASLRVKVGKPDFLFIYY